MLAFYTAVLRRLELVILDCLALPYWQVGKLHEPAL